MNSMEKKLSWTNDAFFSVANEFRFRVLIAKVKKNNVNFYRDFLKN